MPTKQKHPVARIRAAIAGVDLFFPSKSAWAKRRKVKKFLRRTISDEASTRDLISAGIAGSVTKYHPLRKRHYLANKYLETKKSVFHEFAHFFKLGKNHLLTANAFNGYFNSLFINHKLESFNNLLNHYRDALNRTEWAIKKRRKVKSNDEHVIGGIGWVGRAFGFFAADMELQWKKPVSGLFLIREVCNGTPVKKVIAEIESGKFDVEIKAFAKKHFANLLGKR